MKIENQKILVCGAGGFIGGHLVKDLLESGAAEVRAVDIKPLDEWYQVFPDVENLCLDLQDKQNCYRAAEGATAVFQLAADMGGMGFIENNRALCMLSVLINTHMLMAAKDLGVQRFLYSSSACVYNGDKQTSADVIPLKEEDAYPALPEDGYGWEKLFSERMCRHFEEDFGLQCRVPRFHNVYGPHGTWDGGREKAPAAVCRKVLQAKISGSHQIEIWGDGLQTRSFMYIDDCLHGVKAIFESDIREPINLGSSELVTINQLVDIVEDIAGVKLKRNYKLDAPRGVNGRNSDNMKIKQYLGWEPSIRLRDGMAKTYAWIETQMRGGLKAMRGVAAAIQPASGAAEFRQILGVRFFVGEAKRAIELLADGGLLVVPAAPALKNLSQDTAYREALLEADVTITDSSLMVVVWNFLQRDNIRRLSGLEYLVELLRRPGVREPGRSFWIMASPASASTNLAWLREKEIEVLPEDVYLAPIYKDAIEDEALLQAIRTRRPAHIIVTLGGGTQERLGLYLKRNLDPVPAIHCIGAAIAFLSGDQVHIPMWADRFYFGWLFRCLSEPRRYIPRYWSARKLVALMLRYRDQLPVPQS